MSLTVTGLAQVEAWRQRVLPPTELVRPGLWSVPVPIPDNPLRYVNVYVLEQADGITLVDAGWPTEDAWQALVDGLAATGHAVDDVRGVLVTHAHADHFGLAARVRQVSGAWVALHELDAPLTVRHDPDLFRDRQLTWLLARGVPAAELPELVGRPEDYEKFFSVEPPDRLLKDGDRPLAPEWDLTTVWTPGHTPGHVCFLLPGERRLLTGDHVLPRISPNINGQLHDDHPTPVNPLDTFVDSLRAVAGLPVDEVLPAHEYRFIGLAERVEELVVHHEARLAETEEVVSELRNPSTWDVARHVTWSRPWPENRGIVRRSAVGETYAHLLSLEAAGRVRRPSSTPDEWWSTAAAGRSPRRVSSF